MKITKKKNDEKEKRRHSTEHKIDEEIQHVGVTRLSFPLRLFLFVFFFSSSSSFMYVSVRHSLLLLLLGLRYFVGGEGEAEA